MIGPTLPGTLALDSALLPSIGSLPLSAAFIEQAQRMPPLSRRLLLLEDDAASVQASKLFDELMLSTEVRAAAELGLEATGDSAVLQRSDVLSPEACAALRAAVDAEIMQKCDTVDGAPDNQLGLSRERLDQLVGPESAAALWSLPAAFDSTFDAEEAKIFIRRYAPDERPWNPFHTDSSAMTINVALSGPSACEGGELLACFDGRVRRLPRAEGGATVHSATLLHAVSLLRSGTRYALIVFIGQPRVELPPELRFDAGARAREAADLRWLLEDARSIATCAAVLGHNCSQLVRAAAAAASRDQWSLGWDVQRVVQRYAAPHLRPSKLRAVAAADGDAGDGRWCWGLRALLIYYASPPQAPHACFRSGRMSEWRAGRCES